MSLSSQSFDEKKITTLQGDVEKKLTGSIRGRDLRHYDFTSVTSQDIQADDTTLLPDGYKVVQGYIFGKGVDLQHAFLENAEVIQGMDLSHTNFKGAVLNRIEFVNCDLSHATFDSVILIDVNFEECKIIDASFKQTVYYPMVTIDEFPVGQKLTVGNREISQVGGTWEERAEEIAKEILRIYGDGGFSFGVAEKLLFEVKEKNLNILHIPHMFHISINDSPIGSMIVPFKSCQILITGDFLPTGIIANLGSNNTMFYTDRETFCEESNMTFSVRPRSFFTVADFDDDSVKIVDNEENIRKLLENPLNRKINVIELNDQSKTLEVRLTVSQYFSLPKNVVEKIIIQDTPDKIKRLLRAPLDPRIDKLVFVKSAYDAITLNAMEAHHIGYRPIFAADNIDTHPNSFYQIDQIILEDTKSNIHRFMQNSYSKLLFTQLRLLNKFGEANPMNRIPVPTDLFEMFYTDNQNDLNNNLFIPQNQNY